MQNFWEWLCSFEVVFHVNFWDVFIFFMVLMLLWFWILGNRLYKVFKTQFPNATVDDWFDSKVGKIFLLVVLTPFIVFLMFPTVVVLPFVMAYVGVKEWLGKRKK